METFETIKQFAIDNPIITGLIILGIALILIIIGYAGDESTSGVDMKPVEDEKEDEPEDEYPANGEDTIICKVPGLEEIRLTPNQFYEYSEEYTGVWSVTLRSGSCIYIPMQYTVILDNSYFTIISKTNAQ